MTRAPLSVRIGFGDTEDPRVRAALARLEGSVELTPVSVAAPPRAASPVEHLAELVRAGELDAGVAGSLTTSAEVVRAGIRALRVDDVLVTSCFAIGTTDPAHVALGRRRTWATYADCAVVPEPDAAQLAEIALSAADFHAAAFQEEPRVAMLSFSTAASAAHPRVRLVQEASRLAAGRRAGLLVEGDLQFDVAVTSEVAARKLPGSAVAGRANVLVFPSLEAGNIAYKVAQRIGGATALGSFVLGLRRPWVDLSRGCSVNDIVATARLLARVAASPAPPADPGAAHPATVERISNR